MPAHEETVLAAVNYRGQNLPLCGISRRPHPRPKSSTTLCLRPDMKKEWLLCLAGCEIARLPRLQITPNWNCLIGRLLCPLLWEGPRLRGKWLGWPWVGPLSDSIITDGISELKKHWRDRCNTKWAWSEKWNRDYILLFCVRGFSMSFLITFHINIVTRCNIDLQFDLDHIDASHLPTWQLGWPRRTW